MLNNETWDIVCVFFTKIVDKLTSSCLNNEDCEFVNNCILLNKFVRQFLCKCLFWSQSKHVLFVTQSFCSSKLVRVYDQVCVTLMSIELYVAVIIFKDMLILVSWIIVIVMIVAHVIILWNYADWLYLRSSSICWHKIANLSRFFKIILLISCIQILFDMLCCKIVTLADLFQFSSSIKSRNLEKKLVNSWFLC